MPKLFKNRIYISLEELTRLKSDPEFREFAERRLFEEMKRNMIEEYREEIRKTEDFSRRSEINEIALAVMTENEYAAFEWYLRTTKTNFKTVMDDHQKYVDMKSGMPM